MLNLSQITLAEHFLRDSSAGAIAPTRRRSAFDHMARKHGLRVEVQNRFRHVSAVSLAALEPLEPDPEHLKSDKLRHATARDLEKKGS